jgi:hypothetical protein
MAFWIFIALFCGGLGAITIGMIWVAVTLFQPNQRARRQSKSGLPRPATALIEIDSGGSITATIPLRPLGR